MLFHVPILTANGFPLAIPIIFIPLLFLALIGTPSHGKTSSSAPKIEYHSTENLVQKFKNMETLKLLAKELRSRECLGKISFNPSGCILTAHSTRKSVSVYRYSFRELDKDVSFSPGEQEAILRVLITHLPEECDYKFYYEQSVDSSHPHYFYIKSKRYRTAEKEGSL